MIHVAHPMGFATRGKLDLLHRLVQLFGQARGGCNEIWEPFGKHFAGAVRVAKKELAHREHNRQIYATLLNSYHSSKIEQITRWPANLAK